MARLRSQYRDPRLPAKLRARQPAVSGKKMDLPIRYDPLAPTPAQQQEILLREIVSEIHQRLLGQTVTPRIAGTFRVAIEDELRRVTSPATGGADSEKGTVAACITELLHIPDSSLPLYFYCPACGKGWVAKMVRFSAVVETERPEKRKD